MPEPPAILGILATVLNPYRPLLTRWISIGTTKVVGPGTVRWAWARITGLPCFGAALKRVIGEEAGIGACSGKMTTALPKPLPTIEPGQSLRACGVVVAASLPGVQTGRPFVSTSPFLSNQIVTVSTIGGGVPSLVPILP